jgi:tetratricopeptide (TPR) repeat protein
LPEVIVPTGAVSADRTRHPVLFRLRLVTALVGTVLIASGCATRHHAPGLTLAEADALAQAGCYRCLVEAQAAFEGAYARRPSVTAARRVFRTALLLTAREKELGLPATAHLARAREVAARLPDPQVTALVTAAAGLGWDVAGRSPEDRESFVKLSAPRGGQLQEWRAALRPFVASDVLTAYLDTALACQYEAPTAREPAALLARAPRATMIAFAVGANCRHAASIDEVIATDPRYVEARFFRGRATLANAATGRASRHDAVPDLTAAYEAFPRSPSVTAAMAGLARARNQLDEAVRYYDETLALVPGHREALVGRTVALSYLARHEDGLATASRLVDLGQWYLGDAHYWRAYNQLHLRQLDDALASIERAKALQPINSETFSLAGIIRYERKEAPEALAELHTALRLHEGNCTAAWYLGLVHVQQAAARDASSAFERAAGCYADSGAQLRAELATLLAALADDRETSALSADYGTLIAQAARDEGRSCYNAAYTSAQAGEKARALALARRAAATDEMKEKANALIAALTK